MGFVVLFVVCFYWKETVLCHGVDPPDFASLSINDGCIRYSGHDVCEESAVEINVFCSSCEMRIS